MKHSEEFSTISIESW